MADRKIALSLDQAARDWLADAGNIATDEMRRTFNCGIGMVAVVAESDLATTLSVLSERGEDALAIGRVADGAGPVRYL